MYSFNINLPDWKSQGTSSAQISETEKQKKQRQQLYIGGGVLFFLVVAIIIVSFNKSSK